MAREVTRLECPPGHLGDAAHPRISYGSCCTVTATLNLFNIQHDNIVLYSLSLESITSLSISHSSNSQFS